MEINGRKVKLSIWVRGVPPILFLQNKMGVYFNRIQQVKNGFGLSLLPIIEVHRVSS